MPEHELRPNGNGTAQGWDRNDWTLVDEAVTPPATPTGGTDTIQITDKNIAGSACEVKVEDIPATANGTLDTFRVWTYVTASGTSLRGVTAKIDGVWGTELTTPSGSDGSWDYWDFPTSKDISGGLTGNGVRFTNQALDDGDEIDVWCFLVRAIHTVSAPPGPPPFVGTRDYRTLLLPANTMLVNDELTDGPGKALSIADTKTWLGPLNGQRSAIAAVPDDIEQLWNSSAEYSLLSMSQNVDSADNHVGSKSQDGFAKGTSFRCSATGYALIDQNTGGTMVITFRVKLGATTIVTLVTDADIPPGGDPAPDQMYARFLALLTVRDADSSSVISYAAHLSYNNVDDADVSAEADYTRKATAGTVTGVDLTSALDLDVTGQLSEATTGNRPAFYPFVERINPAP